LYASTGAKPPVLEPWTHYCGNPILPVNVEGTRRLSSWRFGYPAPALLPGEPELSQYPKYKSRIQKLESRMLNFWLLFSEF
jgi:hypothetical protein